MKKLPHPTFCTKKVMGVRKIIWFTCCPSYSANTQHLILYLSLLTDSTVQQLVEDSLHWLGFLYILFFGQNYYHLTLHSSTSQEGSPKRYTQLQKMNVHRCTFLSGPRPRFLCESWSSSSSSWSSSSASLWIGDGRFPSCSNRSRAFVNTDCNTMESS